MNSNLTLAARLQLDSQRWTQGLNTAQGKTRGFVSGVRKEFAQLRGFMSSTSGVLASLGVGYGISNQIMKSAQADLSLTRIKQTAGLTVDQVKTLRGELHGMARESGNSFESLQEGFGQLAAGGLSFDQALPTINAINKSMRVTGTDASTLATALQSAQTHFGFDLTQPKEALRLLDMMTVAGRAGVIEIEDLSGVFASAAGNAKAAGLTFEQTLALAEGLGTATTKDRVGTLMDSTLRLFTNANYMKAAQKATGVQFFDDEGGRRNPLVVLTEIKSLYDKLGTDKDRFNFISKAFGKADLDTIKGINQAMKDGKMSEIIDIASKTAAASGTTASNMSESMANSIAQAGVMRATLTEAMDGMSAPINKAITESIKFMTSKEGMDMDGKEMLGGGAAAVAGGYALSRVLPPMLAKIFGDTASVGSGIVMGNVLQQAGVATPVFIVGAAPGLFTGGPAGGPISDLVDDGKKPKGRIAKWLADIGPAAIAAALPAVFASEMSDYPDALAKDQAMRESRGGKMPYEKALDWLLGKESSGVSGMPGKLDVQISVKDDRVSASVVNAEGVNRVRTTNARGTRPRTGRMMDSAGGGL